MPTIEVLPNTHASGATWGYTALPPAHLISSFHPTPTSRTARKKSSTYEHTAARQRQINSRISDLEKDNYRDAQIPIPGKKAGGPGSATTTNVRRILASQKTFVNHLADEEAMKEVGGAGDKVGEGEGEVLGYARAVCRPSKRAPRVFCEICGYWGSYRCGKCGARYCGLECSAVHQDTRCQKFYA